MWVAGSVHGNEPSGADADLRLLRDLARRCEDPLLRRVVVVVLPDQNPDGHEAQTRVNANGFDLNRDWLAVTQPETEARLRALLAMPPLAYADQHEQGGDGFFSPPYSAPMFHELPEAALAAERDVLGPAIHAALGRAGYPPTTGGSFDLLYPGYGDSATMLLFGAAGMTLEAGVARPYVQRVAEHLAAANAVVRSVARHRAALLKAWAGSFAQATRQGARGLLQHRARPRVYGYALGAGREPLVARLLADGVAVGQLAAPAPVASLRPYGAPTPGAPATLAAGTYLVSAAQPLKHWIEALLGQNPSASGPSTSDVNAWSRPLLMGVTGGTLGSPLPAAPPAAVPVVPAAQPLAGRRLALLADPVALASVAPGIEQPNAGTSWARWVLARLGAQVDAVDDAGIAAGALAGHDAIVVSDGAPASLSGLALQAISAFVAGGGTVCRLARAGRRGRGRRRAHAGDDRRRAGRHLGAGRGSRRREQRGGRQRRPADRRRPCRGRLRRRAERLDLGLAGGAPGDPRRAPRRRPRRPLRLRSRLPRVQRERRGAAHERTDRRHSRCSMIRAESQTASSSITSRGTWRCPLSFSISGRSRMRHATRTSS